MTFKAYIDNIQAKTGKTPDNFKQIAYEKGFIRDGSILNEIKASTIVQWLKEDYQLGHGHAMAIYALLKGTRSS